LFNTSNVQYYSIVSDPENETEKKETFQKRKRQGPKRKPLEPVSLLDGVL